MFTYDPYAELAALRPVPALQLESNDFINGGTLPSWAWGADAREGGADRSPHLAWSGLPAGTQSLALSVFDPDAPTGSGFWHWAVYNLPVDLTELAQGAGSGADGALPAGAITLPNEYRLTKFIGAAPPAGTGVHRYFFVLDALDVPALNIPEGATPAVLGFNRFFHSLARGVLMGTASSD